MFTNMFITLQAAGPDVINGNSVLSIVMILAVIGIGIGTFALMKGGAASTAVSHNAIRDEVRAETDAKLDRLQLNQTVKEQSKEIEELKDSSRENGHLHQYHQGQQTYSPKA